MYYLGTPFVKERQRSRIIVADEMLFYKDTLAKVEFAESVIERYKEGKVDLVFYTQAYWKDAKLQHYHRDVYGSLNYFTENIISTRSSEVIAVVEFAIKSIRVSHYTAEWLLKVEQMYDSNYSLLEYREMFYEGASEVPLEEKIFFPSNWIIHKENYS